MSSNPRRERIESLLRDDPNDEFLRYGLAMEYVGGGDHETAVRHFRELIALNPGRPYVPAFLMGAQSLVQLGRAGEAVAMLRDGIAAAAAQNNEHARGEMQTMLETLQ